MFKLLLFIWKSAVIGLRFFRSADVRGAETRDEPLRTSAWEASDFPQGFLLSPKKKASENEKNLGKRLLSPDVH